jgi:predicted component of type VI protein secretion system
VSGLDLSRLAPDDAVAALRSYPRRFRALLTSVEPQDLPQEAVEHADHVARSVALLGEALRQVLIEDEPTLLPAVADDAARQWAFDGSSVPEDVLAFLTMECNALADVIANVPTDAWTRVGVVAGSGQKMSALDIVREAVRTGADYLRATERAIKSR